MLNCSYCSAATASNFFSMTSIDFLSNSYFFVALLAISSLLALQFLSKKTKKKYPPIAGTFFNQLLNFNRLHHYTTDLARKHKTYRFLSPSRNKIYTSDPENVEYILKTNFDNFGKGLYNYQNLSDLLGDGIFAVDGEKWRQQRKISSHVFSARMLREFSSGIFRENALKLANVVSEAATSNLILEIQDLFLKSTMDSIFQIGFGTEIDSMGGSSEEGKKFADAFDTSSELTLCRYLDVFWRIKKFLNVGSEAQLRENTKIVNEFVFKLINTRIQQLQTSVDDSDNERRDILSRFLDVNEFDATYLRDIILNFVIAGKDTTAGTLAWFIYMVCKYPAVQEKVAKEVKETTYIKGSESLTELVSSITDEALEKMNYLHAAITETLRLYPAVPVNTKICFSDDKFPDGYSVNKGDLVVYQPYAMGRMKFIWGDDAEEFRPERWLDDNGIFQRDSPFKFTAFQAGPRICLGKEFAYRQMKIFCAVLLSRFHFELNDHNKIATYRIMLTLHIKGGLQIRPFFRQWD